MPIGAAHRWRAHLLLFWAVQGSGRMENGLLGIVEELRDVLQVFGGALVKNRSTQFVIGSG